MTTTLTRNTLTGVAPMAPDRNTPVLPRNRAKRQETIGRSIAENLPPICVMQSNLRNVLDQATEEEWAEGLAWYHMARIESDIARRIAALAGRRMTRRQAIGVAAGLSPQLSWTMNVRLLKRAARNGVATGQTKNACTKANRIMAGECPRLVLGGPKVRSFDRNQEAPDHPGAVTVDRHCLDMLVNLRGYTADKPLDAPGVYQLAAAVIRGEARRRGVTPCALQAVAWIVWRRINGVTV